MNQHTERDSIFLEQAEILSHSAREEEQYILRVHAPQCAAHAQPGSFAHITCHPMQPLRRPISIMRCSPREGWVEFLYKAVGVGTQRLSRRERGESISLLGPIGKGFILDPTRPRPLLIGGGVGMPPMIFLADRLHTQPDYKPFVILGSEVPFPFQTRPSQLLIPGMPAGVIATLPLLDDWHIPTRLASRQGFPGCFQGYVTDLAKHWLDTLEPEQRQEVELFACGPHPMLEAVAKLAADYALPCQVSVEEFMACGVGGCAGCTLEVNTPEGPAMKRVCVDGPVFRAEQVFF